MSIVRRVEHADVEGTYADVPGIVDEYLEQLGMQICGWMTF